MNPEFKQERQKLSYRRGIRCTSLCFQGGKVNPFKVSTQLLQFLTVCFPEENQLGPFYLVYRAMNKNVSGSKSSVAYSLTWRARNHLLEKWSGFRELSELTIECESEQEVSLGGWGCSSVANAHLACTKLWVPLPGP